MLFFYSSNHASPGSPANIHAPTQNKRAIGSFNSNAGLPQNHKNHPAHFLTLVISLELAIYISYFFNSQHMKLYEMQPFTHNVYYQVKVCGILQSFENSWVDGRQGDHLHLSAEWVCIRVLITLIFILNDEG